MILSKEDLDDEAGFIFFGDHRCEIVQSNPTTFDLVYLFPFKGSNGHIREALKYFGEIKEVRHQQWINMLGIYTGPRAGRMVRMHKITRNTVIGAINCRVRYKGQPLVCDIRSDNHKASACPLKGKCGIVIKRGTLFASSPNLLGLSPVIR